MNRQTKSFSLFLILFFTANFSYTQEEKIFDTETEKEELKFNINSNGSHYFKFTFLNQVWLRYNESNPGTIMDSEPKSETFDIGLRRTRIQMFGQITDKVFLYFQIGQNNFNTAYNSNGGNRKNALFMHDALGEYKVSKTNALKLGAGLTINNGLSRFSQPSIGSIMTADVPVFAQATVEQVDQFARRLSVYARGQVSKLDYRIGISDPFPISSTGNTIPQVSVNSNFANTGRNKQLYAYFIWQFFEHENHLTPYMTGTHLGKKKVFNIAVGGIHQKNAMWNRPSVNDSIAFEDMNLFCVESYLDIPINKSEGSAISAYAGYFMTDYGKNYLRYNGLMNPANGSSLNPNINITKQGANFGNAYPMFGSGSQLYCQLGYLFPRKVLGEKIRLMPYASVTLSKFDRLNSEGMELYNAGLNWLIKEHRSKISIDWQNRPTYFLNSNMDVQSGERRNQIVLQYQIYI
ncbi:MAG: hypothetical protein R2852_05740 [Bacteroidia bacterium]